MAEDLCEDSVEMDQSGVEDVFGNCSWDSPGFTLDRLNNPNTDTAHTSTPTGRITRSQRKGLNDSSNTSHDQSGMFDTPKTFFSKKNKRFKKSGPLDSPEIINKSMNVDNPNVSNSSVDREAVEYCSDTLELADSFWDKTLELDALEGNKENNPTPDVPACEDIDILNLSIEDEFCVLHEAETLVDNPEVPPDITPDFLLGLNPFFWINAKLTVKSIAHLRQGDNAFFIRQHPIRSVSIIGLVTSLQIKDKYNKFMVDDTTGRIECMKWNNSNDSSVLNDLAIGNLVHVKGKLGTFRDEREVKVYNVNALPDFNQLTFHLLQCNEAMKVYNVDFVLPDCSELINDVSEKIKDSVQNSILAKGAAENIEEYAELAGVKKWLECLTVITKEAKSDLLSKLVREITPGTAMDEERRHLDKIRDKILELLTRNPSLTFQGLKAAVTRGIAGASDDQIISVLDGLLMSGDVYESDMGVYKIM